MRQVIRDMRAAGGVTPQDDLLRITAVVSRMRFEPSDQTRQIFDARRILKLRRKTIVDGDADQTLTSGPHTDVVVER